MAEKMLKTVGAVLHEIAPPAEKSPQKITVVGTGQVGMACAYSILQQSDFKRTCSELVLVDVVANKVKGEVMDLQHGLAFTGRCVVKGDTTYECTAGSKLCIVTAGLRQKEGESRLSLVQRNTDIFKKIIPELVKYSPETIIMVVSNPVDVLTYVTWKLSGLPRERVFGSGTNLDSARFRFLLSQRLNIAPSSCHGWIIGEHGDSSGTFVIAEGHDQKGNVLKVSKIISSTEATECVPVWSGVNVAGVTLAEVSKTLSSKLSLESWEMDLHRQVVESAYEIIKMKGYTCWGIGLSVAKIARGIIHNSRNVCALTTNVKGMHGITDDVYLSLPCVVGMNGITHIIKQNLSKEEGLCSELSLVDVVSNKVKGEMMDLQHGLAFTRRCVVNADTDYACTAGSNLCIVTAGLRQKEGESRLSLVQRNTNILKKIIPELVKYSPETLIMVVSNPGQKHLPLNTKVMLRYKPIKFDPYSVDVLTYVTWKLSGLSRERVFGSGTNLDSARFRFLLSQELNVSPSSCHAWIIGEHGDSSVTACISSAYEIIKLKGYTCWGIGLSVAKITRGIMRNSRNLNALSINVKVGIDFSQCVSATRYVQGLHGITDDVYLSVPCVVGVNGVTHVVKQTLNKEEIEKLHQSWKTLFTVQTQIEFDTTEKNTKKGGCLLS
ncbi:L-lactate dehydrogenase [Necator americanus]|uniref:L-lactate dehydrogenase n=1 Tax=Necator americanus TaxID=51031 RepID=W2STE0_NECAM|nr:L-lactate dehydrogenase [Necator americanus]ETN71967.1 L-lactate dehydrogenase [Necator americanus]